MLVTVKEWLKSVLNYRSYPKIKMGIRFWTTLYVAGHPPLNRRCSKLPVSIRLRNDLYCVGFGMKLLTHSHTPTIHHYVYISHQVAGDCHSPAHMTHNFFFCPASAFTACVRSRAHRVCGTVLLDNKSTSVALTRPACAFFRFAALPEPGDEMVAPAGRLRPHCLL